MKNLIAKHIVGQYELEEYSDILTIKINKDSLCPCHKAGDEKTPHNLGDSIAGAHAYYIDNTGKVYFGIILSRKLILIIKNLVLIKKRKKSNI